MVMKSGFSSPPWPSVFCIISSVSACHRQMAVYSTSTRLNGPVTSQRGQCSMLWGEGGAVGGGITL